MVLLSLFEEDAMDMLNQPLDNSGNEQNSRDKIHSIANEKVPFESVDATMVFFFCSKSWRSHQFLGSQ